MKKKKLVPDSRRYSRHALLKKAGYTVRARDKTVFVTTFQPDDPKIKKCLDELVFIGYNIQLTIA